jgi:hypothetical protein
MRGRVKNKIKRKCVKLLNQSIARYQPHVLILGLPFFEIKGAILRFIKQLTDTGLASHYNVVTDYCKSQHVYNRGALKIRRD